MKAVDVLISGRVQKVGYRAFTRKNALLLGIKGYVENMPDGKVHAVIEGDDHQIDKLLELIRQGPVGSQVRDVKVAEIEKAGYQGFEIR
ncbi:acylphosphatase [Methanocella sp. MCL-LM]|uniref:acylphosphatase n=1 Tax=Methanocella sp. MCL-LM TaxID=3412035 RepID=UPI003C753E32